MATRRIPSFGRKLADALTAANLPDRVTPHVWEKPDPTVVIEYEYTPGSYANAMVDTDARDEQHLDPVFLIGRAHEKAEKQTRDPRYTEKARAAAREFADVLAVWLAQHTPAGAA